jgi:hypothetical protein
MCCIDQRLLGYGEGRNLAVHYVNSGASVSILGQAEIVGVELAAVATPLVQWP